MSDNKRHENITRGSVDQEETSSRIEAMTNRIAGSLRISATNNLDPSKPQQARIPGLSLLYEIELPKSSSNNATANTSKDSTKPVELEEIGADKTFHDFPRLPPELRKKVWMLALPEQRFVKVFWTYEDMHAGRAIGATWYAIAADKAPALFFACHESRYEITQRYEPFKGNAAGKGTVWIDPTKDVLCFDNSRRRDLKTFLDSTPRKLRDSLTHIAFITGCFVDGLLFDDVRSRCWPVSLAYALGKTSLPALKQLSVAGKWRSVFSAEEEDNDVIIGFKITADNGKPLKVDGAIKLALDDSGPLYQSFEVGKPSVRMGRFVYKGRNRSATGQAIDSRG